MIRVLGLGCWVKGVGVRVFGFGPRSIAPASAVTPASVRALRVRSRNRSRESAPG